MVLLLVAPVAAADAATVTGTVSARAFTAAAGVHDHVLITNPTPFTCAIPAGDCYDVLLADDAGITSAPADCVVVDANTVRCEASGPITVDLGDQSDTLNANEYNGTFQRLDVQGGDGADNLSGGALADVLDGGPGDDTLTGGYGDRLVGGAGADSMTAGEYGTVDYTARTEPLTLRPGLASGAAGENDVIHSALTVIGGHGADTITGFARPVGGPGADHITGSDNITFNGNPSSRTLVTWPDGDDVIDGVADLDWSSAPSGVSISFDGVANDGIAGQHAKVDLAGATYGSTITTTPYADTIDTGSLNARMTFRTGAGADQVHARYAWPATASSSASSPYGGDLGAGDDTWFACAPPSNYYGGSPALSGGADTDTISLADCNAGGSASSALPNGYSDVTVGFEGIEGSDAADTIDTSGPITIHGGAGPDRISTAAGYGASASDVHVDAGPGDDSVAGYPGGSYLGGADHDTFRMLSNYQSVQVRFPGAAHPLVGDADVQLAPDFEALAMNTAGTVWGNDLANEVTVANFTGGAVMVHGGGGDDHLSATSTGYEFGVHLFGDGGSDVIVGGIADYSTSATPVDVTLDHLANDGSPGEHDNVEPDRVVGSDFDDRLVGSPGVDWLDGGAGDDLLDGAAGDDTVLGGPGTDLLDLSDRTGDLVVNLREGIVREDGVLRGDSLLAVEGIIGGSGDDDLSYDTQGSPIGPLVMFGGEGNDRIQGAGGSDYLDGGPGLDTVSYEGARPSADGENIICLADDACPTSSGGATEDDYLVNFEDAVGSSYDDVFIGTSGTNWFSGGSGFDVVDYSDRTEPLALTLDGIDNDGAPGEHDQIENDVEGVVGGSAPDVIVGSAWADYLGGGDGSDEITPGSGRDFVDTDAGLDAVHAVDGELDTIDCGGQVETIERDAVDVLSGCTPLQAPAPTPAAAPAPTVAQHPANVATAGADRLVGTRGADRIDGRGGNDRIFGYAGNDRLVGGAGNDWLDGGAGRDVLDGGAGNDHLVGGADADRVTAGPGNDVIDVRDRRGGDIVTCGAGRDRVLADRADRVARDCEHVTRTRS